MSELPIMLHGEAIEALIVGGGAVAARKARALLIAGARVRVVALEIGADLRALADAHEKLHLEERPYAPSDIGNAQLVLASTNDRALNRRVADDAHAAHRIVNVADDPARGNCRTTATHRAGDLVIGITAGGVPSAAVRIRDSLAARFDDRYADAVATLATLRRRLLDSGASEEWTRASEVLLDESFCERVERGTIESEAARWG
ncbi:MAG TPA: bifunctional precorrin-2 dehydrogenase/sirohydrochlorin ferrochelatase [Gemmatimonadaceae bacterium]|nr:bifunctional precorrin-2 dehydrogenase/sirohydrochlorin ferrochelatase [Gemmatimonadaceae bacterium]